MEDKDQPNPTRKFTPEEVQAMLEWLEPCLSVWAASGPYERGVPPWRFVEIALERHDARHMTEFLDPDFIRLLVERSKSPHSFYKNLEQLILYRRSLGH